MLEDVVSTGERGTVCSRGSRRCHDELSTVGCREAGLGYPLGGQEMVVSSLLDIERMYKLMKEMFIFK